MPRSGRIRRSRRAGLWELPPARVVVSLLQLHQLLGLLLLLVPCAQAQYYDEALARRMIVYSSIAISEPEQVDAWAFPNPRESVGRIQDSGRDGVADSTIIPRRTMTTCWLAHQSHTHNAHSLQRRGGARPARPDLPGARHGVWVREWPNPCRLNHCRSGLTTDTGRASRRPPESTHSYIVQNDAERYILAAFKGSNDTRDWIEHDLRSTPFAYHRPCTVDRATGATLREPVFILTSINGRTDGRMPEIGTYNINTDLNVHSRNQSHTPFFYQPGTSITASAPIGRTLWDWAWPTASST